VGTRKTETRWTHLKRLESSAVNMWFKRENHFVKRYSASSREAEFYSIGLVSTGVEIFAPGGENEVNGRISAS